MNEKRDALVQAKRAGTPSYSFKVGDSVILGAIESVHVEKVLYDGLCYEVCCTKVDKTTGKRTLEHRIEPWYKIRPKFFGKSEFTTNEGIRLNYSNITSHNVIFWMTTQRISVSGQKWEEKPSRSLTASMAGLGPSMEPIPVLGSMLGKSLPMS